MPPQETSRSARTVLLADDPTIVHALRDSMVARADWQLVTAASPARALERARADHPDVAILDAEAWGQEAASALRADRTTAAIPIVLVTASSRARLDPADAVLRRPLDRAELERVVPALVDARARSSSRRPVGVRATYFHGGAQATALLKDLGPGGAFVRTRAPLPVGDPVELILTLGDEPAETVRVAAEVVRSVSAERDSHLVSGVAVRFVRVGARDRRRLEGFAACGSVDG
jgi:CheY-like chemotaxis protein/Tfp pilus assembly protein PilZ